MVGSSILPACFYKGQLYFLFGRENSLADTPGWSDFGGGVEQGESIFETALREGSEELSGFIGDSKQIGSLIKKNGGVYKMQHETYHIHLFHMDYNEDLVKHYNDNHRFLWQRMNKKYLSNTRLFEKIEIKWFSLDEMKRRKDEFRNFYRNVIDETLLREEAQIRAFLSKRKGQNRSSQRRSNTRKTQKKASRGWFF
jgi:8-oxo-dGTP pyrophosphatase MutT (NUDIX family)